VQAAVGGERFEAIGEHVVPGAGVAVLADLEGVESLDCAVGLHEAEPHRRTAEEVEVARAAEDDPRHGVKRLDGCPQRAAAPPAVQHRLQPVQARCRAVAGAHLGDVVVRLVRHEVADLSGTQLAEVLVDLQRVGVEVDHRQQGAQWRGWAEPTT
jgi:hypothetical protein